MYGYALECGQLARSDTFKKGDFGFSRISQLSIVPQLDGTSSLHARIWSVLILHVSGHAITATLISYVQLPWCVQKTTLSCSH